MDTQYRVVTEGKLREGVEEEDFVRAFAQTFKVPEDKARQLLAAGREITLKDNLDKETAEKFQRVLEQQIGLEVRVEATAPTASLSLMSDDSGAAGAHNVEKDTPADSGVRCPKCGSDRVVGDDCLACGVIISRYRARQEQVADDTPAIYATPNAKVEPDREEHGDEEFGLRKVSADSGWHWIAGGWRHFVQNPVAWILAIIIWYLIAIVAGLIPFVGSLAVNLLSPVFVAGLMLGAREQESGGDFTIQHVFAGFSADLGKLVLAGLLYLLGGVALALIVGIFAAMAGFTSLLHHGQPEAMASGFGVVTIMLMVLVILIAVAVMSMAFWFVPLLVVFEGLSPIKAVPMSFSACWKNAMAFLVYGLVAFGLALGGVITLGLGFLVVAPVMAASIYVSYREIFYGVESPG